MLADNLTVLENVVLGAERLHGIGDKAREEINRDLGDLRLRPRPRRARRGPRRRRAPARGDPQGALPRRQDHHPRRADRRARARRRSTRSSTTCASSRAEGHTILFISHKLDEVLDIADDITVMRRGTTVGAAKPEGTTKQQLAELMVGSELPTPETGRVHGHRPGRLLEVRDLTLHDSSGGRCSSDIDLSIHKGEVLGIAGVEGNGQAELVESVMGMRRPGAGTVHLGGRDITALGHARPPRRRHRLHPRGPAPARAAARRARCGRTASSASRPSAGGQGPAHRPGRPPGRTPSASSPSTTSGPPASTPTRGPCPAATSRSSSSAAR